MGSAGGRLFLFKLIGLEGLEVFEQAYEEWMQGQINGETNHRRREFLDKGLRRGTVDFLKHIWYPTVGNFRDLYAEWEVVDFQSGYRYLDLAYMPGGGERRHRDSGLRFARA
jgi:hypothetical protein